MAGDFTLQTLVSTVKNGSTTLYGDALKLPIKVLDAAKNAQNIVDALQALTFAKSSERRTRDAILRELQEVMAPPRP